ncbi:MAG: glucosamine-6-phosphate deaminase [Flavobacteriales bacterium]|jgi:glucosamine-6-phosphate deaminase|nr:glucosamine-6-phosphate deaminase [Flavobacteriales bacterium]|tara:strand:- start:14463 stop:15221 length:759 start_codon:yes stop_codon:yes gene_type:complete
MSKYTREVFDSAIEGSKHVAQKIKELIENNNAEGKKTVLGLATGSTPVKMYKELIRLHKEEGLSFANVITFNLDEYYPMEKDSEHSYWYFMHENLFNHIDIKPENINIPLGNLPQEEVDQHCADYEAKIDAEGGLDIQILGIGRTGHIGFNEPGSALESVTRQVTLAQITIDDAAPGFGGVDHVPTKAITMGVTSVLKAKCIYLMAYGQNKAQIVADTLTNEITDQVPATYLQKHQNTVFVLDNEAASLLPV